MTRLLIRLLLPATALLLAATPAQAARQLTPHAETSPLGTKISPPAIVSGQVVWHDVAQFEQTRATISSVPLDGSGRKRVVARFTQAQPGSLLGVRFDGGEGRIGYSEFQQENRLRPPDRALFNRLATGPPTGPFQELDRCDATDAMPLVANGRRIQVSQNAVAWDGSGCERTGITIRSLAAGYTRRPPNAGGPFFEMAGDLIVYSDDTTGQEVVYDHVNDRVLYRTSGRLPNTRAAFHTSLQADGKMVQTDSSRLQDRKLCNVSVAVFTPAEPNGRAYPFTSCGSDAVISGDRITMMRDAGGGSAELVNTDLNGGDVKVLARFAQPGLMLGLDAEGTQVVWHAYECGGKPLFLGDGTAEPPTAASCPLSFGRQAKVDARRRSIAVPVTCSRGCQTLGLSVDLGGGVRANSTTRTAIRRGTKTIKVPLTSAARRRIGRRDFNARVTASYLPTTFEERRVTRKVRVAVP